MVGGSYTAPPPQALQFECSEWKPDGVKPDGDSRCSVLQLAPVQAMSQAQRLGC